MGRYTETHNEQHARWIAHVARSANATYGENQSSFLLWRLQIEMQRQVEKPTLALIETTAHAKRCGFGLSSEKNLGPALTSTGPQNCAESAALAHFLDAVDELVIVG